MLVILFNGFRMPVYYEGEGHHIKSISHKLFTNKNEVNFWFLCDIFKIKRYYISIGDILLSLGVIFIFYSFV